MSRRWPARNDGCCSPHGSCCKRKHSTSRMTCVARCATSALRLVRLGTSKFEARICELVADHPDLAAIVEPLLIARRVLREQLGVLHRRLLAIVREAIRAVLVDETFTIERIGLEAGPLSQWLYSGLAEAGLPIICVETRHMKAARSAQLNKRDRNDARGIAQMMRAGLSRPVHVKALASQKRQMLLTSRQLLQAKAIDIENDLRGTLRNFGLKVGTVSAGKFEARICELVADHPDLAAIV